MLELAGAADQRKVPVASYSTTASTPSSPLQARSAFALPLRDFSSSTTRQHQAKPLGRHELADGGDVLRVRSTFDYALQRLLASRSRRVLLLKGAPKTREHRA